MTSKKALNIIKNRNINIKINHKIGSRDIANEELNEIANTIDYCIPIIEKDLEVLEIIRNKSVDIKYIRLCMDAKGSHKMYNYSVTNQNDELTEKEYNKITEWLDNGK